MSEEIHQSIYDTEIKLIMPAGLIPEGSKVTKPSGHKVYIIVDEIRIFPADGSSETRKVIGSDEGCRFIVPETPHSADINIVRSHSLMAWVTTVEEARDALDAMIESEEDQRSK